jgi:TIR domain
LGPMVSPIGTADETSSEPNNGTTRSERALARCDWFLLILSPAATASKWVKRELFYALREDAYEGRLVVLDYQPAEPEKLSWTLPDLQWVDFQHDFEDGCRELLRIWGRGYRD